MRSPPRARRPRRTASPTRKQLTITPPTSRPLSSARWFTGDLGHLCTGMLGTDNSRPASLARWDQMALLGHDGHSRAPHGRARSRSHRTHSVGRDATGTDNRRSLLAGMTATLLQEGAASLLHEGGLEFDHAQDRPALLPVAAAPRAVEPAIRKLSVDVVHLPVMLSAVGSRRVSTHRFAPSGSTAGRSAGSASVGGIDRRSSRSRNAWCGWGGGRRHRWVSP